MGIDTHTEYFFFQRTLNSLHWEAVGNSVLDSCLSISLLPTIYQSIIKVNTEFLFKILYSLLFSISPLIIYSLSKKYIGDFYGFLSSFFFMSASNFLMTPIYARTNIAILFFALSIFVIFNEKINRTVQKSLFILFVSSILVSHYSTTYLLFIIFFGGYLIESILYKYKVFHKKISGTSITLLFTLIFLWYAMITEAAFDSGILFIEDSIRSLNDLFLFDSRGSSAQTLFGESIFQKSIPFQIEFFFTWITFAFIGTAILSSILNCKKMIFTEQKITRNQFLKKKLDLQYFIISLLFVGLFVGLIVAPYLSVGYSIERTYFLGIVVLSTFFTIGGIIIANCLKIKPYIVLLLVLIPYFLCTTGAMYQAFDDSRMVTLNSEGKFYDMYYLHDQETNSIKWLADYSQNNTRIYTDFYGRFSLISQGQFLPNSIDWYSFIENKKTDGYVFLRYFNVINNQFVGYNKKSKVFTYYNETDYDPMLFKLNSIYDNGGSEVYR
jgi:uncharacterized membrane protein